MGEVEGLRVIGEPEPPTLSYPSIAVAMATASRAIAAVGKNVVNQDQNYRARGIDDVLDACHAPLADAGIVILPNVMAIDTTERRARSGNPLYHVVLTVEYVFVGPAGDSLSVNVRGEAMDSQDKAINKAMSAALKVALIQTFTIPVNGDDADAHSPDPVASEPAVPDDWTADIIARLRAVWEPCGGKYPQEWIDADIPPVGAIEARGLTESQHAVARVVLDAIEARITGSEGAADAAATEPSDPTEQDQGFTVCAECGADVPAGEQHDADCKTGQEAGA